MSRSGDDSPALEAGSGRLSPSSARRRLGDELRTVRESTGLTLSEAAAAIQRSAATLSRLEKGRSMPRLVDVSALLDHYSQHDPRAVVDGTRERVLGLADVGRKDEWFRSFRDVISSDMARDEYQRYIEFETDATTIRSFEPELIPGLLQMPGYAAAITKLVFPTHTRAQRDRFVEFRLARQHVLQRPRGALNFHVVIGEAALLRVVGSPAIMRDQLRAILGRIIDRPPNIEIRIAPITLCIPAVIGGPFVVMEFVDAEPGLVFSEARTGASYVQNTRAVAFYQNLFEDLVVAALDADQSVALLHAVIRRLG